MFDSRASLPREVRADIEQFLEGARGTNNAWAGARILPVYIRRNIKLAEAPSYGKTIFEYEQNCHGAEDYRKAAEYIQNMESGFRSHEQDQPAIEIREIPQSDDSHTQTQPDATLSHHSEQGEEFHI